MFIREAGKGYLVTFRKHEFHEDRRGIPRQVRESHFICD